MKTATLILFILLMEILGFIIVPESLASSKANPYCNTTHFQPGVYRVSQFSVGLSVTSCIYLSNNKSWITSVISWNNIPCNDYEREGRNSTIAPNGIIFNVFRDTTSIHRQFIKNTCGYSGRISWQSPVENNKTYHTYAKAFSDEYSDIDVADNYYKENDIVNSPSVKGYTRAGREIPKIVFPTLFRIHGHGNYQ